MSIEEISPLSPLPLTLKQYIAALISLLGAAHPIMLARMRLIVGGRRACIVLDDEAVEVAFDRDGLEVKPLAVNTELSGKGATDTATVLALLNGYLEVSDAIFSGRLRVFGEAESIIRMFMAIEILLDAAPRTPALQSLAARFANDKRSQRLPSTPDGARVSWYPFRAKENELKLLEDLDLLPDATG
jgi:hypothetical protein